MYGHTSDISSLSDDERPNAIAALNQTGNIDSIVVNLRNQIQIDASILACQVHFRSKKMFPNYSDSLTTNKR